MDDIFPILIMNARPAAGKSEIIDFLQQTPSAKRRQVYHIGEMKVIDDFPILWSWFEDDDLLESVFNRPRLHTDERGYFLHQDFWHLLIRRINLEYQKFTRDHVDQHTVIIEFSRGVEHGGYRSAFQHLDTAILKRACCLYVNVSYEESQRKNRRRYNPDRPDSILEHGLSDEKLERLYRDDDWFDFTAKDPSYLMVRNFRTPYVVFDNKDDITTQGGKPLQSRLRHDLQKLWDLWCNSQAV